MPSLFVTNDKLMTREDYMRNLKDFSKDTAKYSHIKGFMTWRAFFEFVNNIIFIQHEIKHIFIVKPTFARYTEVDEIYRKEKKSASQMRSSGINCANFKSKGEISVTPNATPKLSQLSNYSP